jgi:hypothetical protein
MDVIPAKVAVPFKEDYFVAFRQNRVFPHGTRHSS